MRKHFKDQWVIALLSTILYPLVDYFFETYLGVVSYLTEDFRIISTPIYVILYWVFGVLFLGYCYHRTYGLTGRTWLAGIATGILAALSGTLMENLFNAMGFYVNSGSSLMIGHVPAYVTLGYIPSFSLMPLYLRHKYLSGLLLFGITGINWFIFYCVFSLL